LYIVEDLAPDVGGLVQQSIKIIAEIIINMNIVVRNKISSKLKNSTSAIGYYSYTNRQTAQKLTLISS